MHSLIKGFAPLNHNIVHPPSPPSRCQETNSVLKVVAIATAIFALYYVYTSYTYQEDNSFLQWAVRYGGDPPVYDCPPEICTWVFEE